MKAKNNMTTGSVKRAIILFALPLLFGNVFQQAYNLVDTAIAGRLLGDDALSAIGSCSSLFNFMMYFVNGLNGGFSLVIARVYGEGNIKKLKNSIATMITINIAAVLTIMLFGVTLLKPVLTALNIPAEIFDDAYMYIQVVFMGVAVTTCYNAQANLLRAMGNSLTPIIFLVISSTCNIALDVLFMAGLKMGVRGAAVATVVSQLISCVLCQITIRRSYKEYRTSKENFSFNKALYKEMFSAGITMALMNCIFALGSLIQQGAINNLGKSVIAGHLAARKIVELFMQPMITLSTACSTLVSQCYGAGKMDRVRSAIKFSVAAEIAMSAVFIVIVYAFCNGMITLLTSTKNEDIIANARMYLYINMPFFLTLGTLYVLRTSIQSIGSRIPPLFSSAIELGLKCFAAFYLAGHFGYRGVCFAEPISWALGAALMVVSFISAYKKAAQRLANNNT